MPRYFEVGIDQRVDISSNVPTGRKSSFLGIPYEVSDCYALKARACPKCGKIELYADFGEKC